MSSLLRRLEALEARVNDRHTAVRAIPGDDGLLSALVDGSVVRQLPGEQEYTFACRASTRQVLVVCPGDMGL